MFLFRAPPFLLSKFLHNPIALKYFHHDGLDPHQMVERIKGKVLVHRVFFLGSWKFVKSLWFVTVFFFLMDIFLKWQRPQLINFLQWKGSLPKNILKVLNGVFHLSGLWSEMIEKCVDRMVKPFGLMCLIDFLCFSFSDIKNDCVNSSSSSKPYHSRKSTKLTTCVTVEHGLPSNFGISLHALSKWQFDFPMVHQGSARMNLKWAHQRDGEG